MKILLVTEKQILFVHGLELVEKNKTVFACDANGDLWVVYTGEKAAILFEEIKQFIIGGIDSDKQPIVVDVEKLKKKLDAASGEPEQQDFYKYYLLERPPMPGAFPNKKDNPPIEFIAFDEKRRMPEREISVWGYVSYEKPLSQQEIEDYELAEEL